MKRPLRLLMTAFDYRPRLGGVATFGYEVARALSSFPEAEVRILAPAAEGAAEFDRTSGVATMRRNWPAGSVEAIPVIARDLARETRDWKPDAVLNLLWLPDGAANWFSKPVPGLASVPYFAFAYGVEVIESRRTIKKQIRGALAPLKRRVFGGARGVFAISNFTAGLVERECGVSPDKIELIYCGVDPAEFYPAPQAPDLVERHGLGGKRVFLSVSRLLDYKGIDRGIAALRYVVERHPDVVYLVCGEGPDRARLEAIARHYRVQSHVIFAGAIPFDRVRDYYNLCDCFVLLTRTDLETPNVEGFGIVFLEAAACGKPAIGGASGGIGDAVENGAGGWLVDPTDDRAIADVMLQGLAEPGVFHREGEKARARALGSLTWRHLAEKIIKRIGTELGDVLN
jgi:phosphatidylinositol alpha-1,6-mannosyltransferase